MLFRSYNFAVIPTVTSAYATWDEPDRERDAARLRRGELVFEGGHRTTSTTPVDARLDEILSMPSESPWPFALGFVATLGFAFVLSNHLVMAAGTAVLAAAVLAAWHSNEPEAA